MAGETNNTNMQLHYRNRVFSIYNRFITKGPRVMLKHEPV